MYKIVTIKVDGIWSCSLMKQREKGTLIWYQKWILMESIEANSFSELMVKIGENNYIDLINKNDE